jgi:hypothetical protein
MDVDVFALDQLWFSRAKSSATCFCENSKPCGLLPSLEKPLAGDEEDL